jgi:NDP-sugar pyrophosphorylase family protein
MKKINIIIPMAGRGSRFSEKKILIPKPLININGKPMIQRAIESLDLDGEWKFIIREDEHQSFISNTIQNIKPNSKITSIDYVTEGPACTALLFKDDINNDDELIIANCDQIMEWTSNRFLDYVRYYDGAVVTYHANTDKNSYARVNKEGLVQEICEKQVISNISLNGIHYWKKGRYFVESAEAMIKDNCRAPNGEFYIGPTYNYMIKKNQSVGIYHIPNQFHHPVGVPDDLDEFIRYENSKTF